MQIVEIFPAVQGEGLLTGVPTVFVRFGKCNLACKWCDTAYHRHEFKEMAPLDIVEEVKKYSSIELVTFTGGEPLIQPSGELMFLIQLLKENGKKIAVESNGVVFDPDVYVEVDFFSISPKLQSAGVPKKNYEIGVKNYIATETFASKGQFKFVVLNEQDIEEVATILEYVPYGIPIIFQPCTDYNETQATYKKKAQKLTEYLLRSAFLVKHNWRFMLQQHVVIYGNQRGV